jgi:nucleoside-diphosphate-sugar epimerase
MKLMHDIVSICTDRRSALPIHVLRLAGIYGPGRSALDTVMRADGDLSRCGADDRSVISRVHVLDIVQLVTAMMDRPSSGVIVNVADDMPASRYDVIYFLYIVLYVSIFRVTMVINWRVCGLLVCKWNLV